mgnify:CR=1 FL=1
MNVVAQIGRLVKDPEISHTTSGTHVARFTLAVPKEGKEKEGADFIRCVAFNKNADVVERYLSKGRQVGATGRLSSYAYEGKDGKKIFGLEFVVNNVTLLSGNSGAKNENAKADETPVDDFNPQDNFEGLDEDIPF